MNHIEKAYERGYRMGRYIKTEKGLEKATERGSKSHMMYDPRMYDPRMKGLIGAYGRGYWDAVMS